MRRTIVLTTGLVSAILLAACSQAATVPVPAKPESTPTSTLGSTLGLVLLDISGSGSHQSNPFTAPSSWDIIWEAESAPNVISGSFISINVYDTKGNPFAATITSQLDPGGKKSDVTHMHHAGTVYLDIAGVSIWHIKAVTT